MATTDLDPVFVKALRLLHSKREDAADQLKQMLDDVISQRKGIKSSSTDTSKPSKKHSEDDKIKRREAEKRSLEKSKQDTSTIDDDLPVIKKVKKESPRPSSSPSRSDEGRQKVESRQENSEKSKKDREERERSRKEGEKKVKHDKEKEREKEKEKEKERSKAKEEVKKDESDDDMDAEDFAFGLGIACVVCNQFGVKSGNQLVECQECHHLYHQECHKPPVTEYDVHDPRFVWYCHRCTKSLKKIASGGKGGKSKSSGSEEIREKPRPQPPSSTGNTTSSAVNVTSSKQPKADNSSGSLFTFRRTDGKGTSNREPSSSSGNPGAKPMSGLASLAANLSGKNEQTKSTKVDNGSKPSRSDQSRSSFGKPDQSDKAALLNTTQRKPEGPKPVVKTSDQSKPSVKPSSGSIKQSQGGASSVVNAEKRVQMMKKKAAIKIQEKRASLK